MNASIEVLGVSGGDVPSYDEYTTHQSGQRLHVRLNVAQQGSAVRDFDGVTVTLHGAVNSQIGSKAALEKVLCLSRTTRYSDFDANLSSKDSAAASMHSEVTFDLPEIIPSLSLSGTTEYTKYSALRDRHQVTGTCNVRYWLEADFKSNGRVARRLSLPVDFSKLLKPSQMTVLASGRTSCTRQPVDVQRRGWRFGRGSKSAPAMSFEVPHELGVVASAPERLWRWAPKTFYPFDLVSSPQRQQLRCLHRRYNECLTPDNVAYKKDFWNVSTRGRRLQDLDSDQEGHCGAPVWSSQLSAILRRRNRRPCIMLLNNAMRSPTTGFSQRFFRRDGPGLRLV